MSDKPDPQRKPEQRTDREDRPESRDPRADLSRQAWEDRYNRYGDAGSDKVGRVADVRDRAAFRQQCGQALDDIKQDLQGASDSMRKLNMGASHGIRPGSPAYEQMFNDAKKGYFSAIDKSSNILFDVDRQTGQRKIDPITGRPKESDFNQAIKQERRLLGQEIGQLQETVRSGRKLSAEEMQKLGVNSSDARAVMEDRIRQDMVLKDLQRASGYAQANFGLALIRSSANMDGGGRANQYEAGQLMLQKASADDPWMLGPPPDANYMKHLRNVMSIADQGRGDRQIPPGQDRQPGPGGDQQIPPGGDRGQVQGGGDQGARLPDGVQMVRDGNKNYIVDGNYRLPSGNDVPGSQTFKNPYDILTATEQSLAKPMSPANIQGFEQAIAAADSLDRASLRGQMGDLQTRMNGMRNEQRDGLGARIQNTERQMDATTQALSQQSNAMRQLLPAVTTAGGGEMLNTLRNLKNQGELNAFLNDPKNKDAVTKFQGLKDGQGQAVGAVFLSSLQQFMNGQAQMQALEAQMPKDYSDAKKAYAQLNALYQSPIDTRARYVRALMSDQQTPENVQRARQSMGELATMDKTLPSDPAFVETAQRLGLTLVKPQDAQQGSGNPADNAQNPSDTRAQQPAGSGATEMDRASMTSISRAYEAIQTVKEGQPLTKEQEQAFQQAIADAAKITPQQIEAQRQALKTELYSAQTSADGKTTMPAWTDAKEAQWKTVSANAENSFKAIDPAKQQQVTALEQQLAQVKDSDQNAVQTRQSIESQLNNMALTDQKVKDYMTARKAAGDFYQANPDAMKRAAYDQAIGQLSNLEHAKAITNGLYGLALNASKAPADIERAKPFLAEAAKDPAALQIVPEIGQLVQAQSIKPADNTSAPPKAGDQSLPQQGTGGLSIDQAGLSSLSRAYQAMAQVKEGQKLSPEVDQAFQQAMADAAKITPQQIEAQRQALKTELYGAQTYQRQDGTSVTVPAWNDAKEQTWTKLMTDIDACQKKMPPATQQEIARINKAMSDLNPQDPNAQTQRQTLNNQLAALADPSKDTDGSVKAFLDKRAEMAKFYQDNPDAMKREAFEQANMQLSQLEHAKSLTAGLYAIALAATKDGDSLNKSKALLTEAMKDPALVQFLPESAILAKQLGGGTAAAPGGDALDQFVPGRAALRQADAILKDQSITSAKERFEKAKPFLEKAIEESNTISIPQVNKQLRDLGVQLNSLTEQQKKENPALEQQLNQQAFILQNIRQQPAISRIAYAVALNQYGVEAKDQAAKDQAVKVLESIAQVDPVLAKDAGIVGALEQAKKGEKIDEKKAVAIGGVKNADEAVKMITGGPMGSGGDPISVVAAPMMSKMMGTYEPTMEAAAGNLAKAMAADPTYTQDQTSKNIHRGKQILGDVGVSLLSGEAGLITQRIASTALKDFGWKGQLASYALGFGAAYGTQELGDLTASKLLGNDRHSLGQNVFSAGFNFGAVKAASWFMGAKDATVARQLGSEVAEVNGVRTYTTPTNLRNFMQANGISAEMAGIKPGMTPVQELSAAREALGAQRSVLNEMFAAGEAVPSALPGGSTFKAYLKPANMFRGLNNFEAVPSLADLNARAGWQNFRYNFMAGASASTLFAAKDYVPGISINPATGKPYTWNETLSMKTGQDLAFQAGVGGLTAGTLVPSMNMLWSGAKRLPMGLGAPFRGVENAVSWAGSKIGPRAVSEAASEATSATSGEAAVAPSQALAPYSSRFAFAQRMTGGYYGKAAEGMSWLGKAVPRWGNAAGDAAGYQLWRAGQSAMATPGLGVALRQFGQTAPGVALALAYPETQAADEYQKSRYWEEVKRRADQIIAEQKAAEQKAQQQQGK